jgi:hypothetical protein
VKFRIYKKLGPDCEQRRALNHFDVVVTNLTMGEAIVLMHKAFDVEQYLSSIGFGRGLGQT